MGKVNTIIINKAQPAYKGQEVPSSVIEMSASMPDIDYTKADAYFQTQAEILHGVLITLPGGTYDRLLGLMLKSKASLFAVPMFPIGE